jgi:hypothetical protein
LIREPLVPRGRRPERRPDLKGRAAEEERVDLLELGDLVPMHLLVREAKRPPVLAVSVLFVPGRLHDAVERHELGHDDPANGAASLDPGVCGRG